LENQRNFFDIISHQFQIKTQQDWKQISLNEIKEEIKKFDGVGLTNKYNGNIFFILFEVYPEIYWFFMEKKHKILFDFTEKFWNSFEIKRKFLYIISFKFQIKTQKDWKQVILKEMKENNRYTKKYNDSLFSILSHFLSDILNWEIFKLKKNIPQYFWDGLQYKNTFSMLLKFTLKLIGMCFHVEENFHKIFGIFLKSNVNLLIKFHSNSISKHKKIGN